MEYLKEYKIMLFIGGDCYESNFATAYNDKEAKAIGNGLYNPQKGQRVVVRSLGFAVDPHTMKKIGRPKRDQIVCKPNYMRMLGL